MSEQCLLFWCDKKDLRKINLKVFSPFSFFIFTVNSGKTPSRGTFFKVEKLLLVTETREDYSKHHKGYDDDEIIRTMSENPALIKVRRQVQKDNQLSQWHTADSCELLSNSWRAKSLSVHQSVPSFWPLMRTMSRPLLMRGISLWAGVHINLNVCISIWKHLYPSFLLHANYALNHLH